MSDLFDEIRHGDEQEAREKFERLQKTALRGAAVAIIGRNNSHGIGKHAFTSHIMVRRSTKRKRKLRKSGLCVGKFEDNMRQLLGGR